jgi:hypothetical protein
MPITLEVGYFNSFYMKRLADLPNPIGPVNPLPDPGTAPWTAPSTTVIEEDWYIEESRIRGGYNNTSTDLGVKAYIVEDNDAQQRRSNSLIYSGIFNSRTGVNQSNQFSVGEEITRSVDPVNGSIQKLYAEDTNLIIFQEDKVNRALIDKDAIYSAEGSAITTTANLVIGQIIEYAGEYGISTNPESFAVYGYQKYFRDKLATVSSTGSIIGAYDIYNKNYVVSLQNADNTYNTLSFEEATNGWVSFYDYKPSSGFSSQGSFFTINDGSIWKHYSDSVNRGNFYGVNNKSSVKLVFNPDPTRVKTFKTISYEGTNGWEVTSLVSDSTGTDLVNGLWVNNIEQATSTADVATFTTTNPGSGFYLTGNNVGTSSDGFGTGLTVDIVATAPGGSGIASIAINQPGSGYVTGDVQTVLANGGGAIGVNATFVLDSYANIYERIYSYDEGVYFENNIPYRAGFDRKQNQYVAAIRNNSPTPLPGQVLVGSDNSGIKAYYATVTIQTDTTTDPGGLKELFAVGATYGR